MDVINVKPGSIDIGSGDGDWQEVVLAPERRVTKGGEAADDLPDEVRGWLKLGVPHVVPHMREAGYAFDLVRFSVSIRGDEDEPFEHVWLKVALESDTADASYQPIAWSMLPLKASNPVEIGAKVNYDANLKLSSVGIGAGREVETKFTRDDVFLEAFNEMRNDPLWEFTATAAVAIRGAYRLVLVVRRGDSVACQGTVHLSATVRRKRWGLISYKAALTGLEGEQFSLGGT